MGWIKGILSIGTIWSYVKWVLARLPKLKKIRAEGSDVIRQARKSIQVARKHYMDDGKLDKEEIIDILGEIDKILKELEDFVKAF